MLFMTPPKEQGIRKGDTLPLRDGFYTVNLLIRYILELKDDVYRQYCFQNKSFPQDQSRSWRMLTCMMNRVFP